MAKHGRARAAELMTTHRRTHVTRDDFVEMKKMGINAVRVPFGYWAFAPRAGEPFFGPCLEFLDAVLEWGDELGMKIVLCLHAGVGFQSDCPPCGYANPKW